MNGFVVVGTDTDAGKTAFSLLFLSAFGDQFAEVLGELLARLVAGRELLRRQQEVGVQPPGQRVRPGLEPVGVGRRHSVFPA